MTLVPPDAWDAPPTHVLYHGNCCDGFGAAYVAWLKYGATVTYLPLLYGQPPPMLPPTARVVMVDFSYKRAVLEAFADSVVSLVVLDHHKTAQAELAGLPYAYFDLTHSGVMLAWAHFFPGVVAPMYVRYIEDHDLYTHRLPSSREMHAGLAGYPLDFQVWSRVMQMLPGDLICEGRIALRHQDVAVTQMCEHATIQQIGGVPVPVVNATTYVGEVANRLAETHPHHAFGCYYFDRADGKRQWGMRSRFGFDVSKVAESYGGGGHPAAAGFETVWGTWPI